MRKLIVLLSVLSLGASDMDLLSEIRDALSQSGIYHHFSPNGNDWDVVHGKLYNYTGGQIPAEIVSAFPAATPQEIQGIQDPHGPGNGEGGSDLSNILTGVGFIGGGYGLGQGGFLPGAVNTGTNALGGGQGGGMWDWLDSITGGGNSLSDFAAQNPNLTNMGFPGDVPGAAASGIDVPGGFGLTDNELLGQYFADNPGLVNGGFSGGVGDPVGASTGITVPSWFGEGSGIGIGNVLRSALGLGGESSGSGGGYGTGGRGILDQFLNDPLGSALNTTPFLLALSEANRQSGQGQETIDQLRGMIPQYNTLSTGAQSGYADLNSQIGDQAGRTAAGYADLVPKYGDLNTRIGDTASGTTGLYDNLLGDITGNQSAFLRAQTDPYDLATHNQRQALQEGLAARGVAGSSFGNMDLGNFDTTRDVGRAGIVGNALQSSLGLRSGVIGNRDTAARAALGMEGANLGAQGNLVGNANEAALRALGMQGQNLGAGNTTALNALTGQRGLFDSVLRNQQVNNVNRNALLGAGLSASGSLFRPQNNDPFGLAALLGRQ